MVLLTYALSLSNYARDILGSLPNFDRDPGRPPRPMTAEEDKKAAAGLARVVDLLCQASGIVQYAADNICPKLEGSKQVVRRLGKAKWPVESGEDAFRGLSM